MSSAWYYARSLDSIPFVTGAFFQQHQPRRRHHYHQYVAAEYFQSALSTQS